MSGRMSKPGAYLWGLICRGTGAVYATVGRAWPGRMLTSYREAEASVGGGRRPDQDACRPISSKRRRMVETLEKGWLLRLLRWLFATLLRCPLAFYGVWGLFYGFGRAAECVFRALLAEPNQWPVYSLVACGVIVAVSILLLLSRHSLGEALGYSRVARLLLVRFLCLPLERLTGATGRRLSLLTGSLAAMLGLAATAVTAHCQLPVLALPLLLLVFGACGMVFTYPEAGVVLSTALLPFVWLDRRAVYVLCGLILVTLGAYGVKLLCLHRTMRLGLLDRAVLILAGYMLLSSWLGVTRTPDILVRSLLLVIILADYFLIVNLMVTRDYIRRCLLGVAVSVVIVTALAFLSRVPVDTLDWLAGSRAGDAIISAFRGAVESLSGLWQEHAEIYLVLVFPWLFAYLMHTRLLTRRVMGLVMLAADFGLIFMTHSITATVCVTVVTVLFLILLGPHWAAAGLVSLPAVAVGGVWLLDRFPVSKAFMVALSRSRHFKDQLRASLWRMTVDHPAGIGVGEDAFAAVYPAYAAPDLGAVTDSGSLFFEILLAYGWPGFILLCAVVFLFLQKEFTCLRYTASRRDRAMLLGGIVSVCGVLVFGMFRSFLTVPRVFFTITLVVALCSAWAGIVFEENDVLTAMTTASPTAEDRLFRRK